MGKRKWGRTETPSRVYTTAELAQAWKWIARVGRFLTLIGQLYPDERVDRGQYRPDQSERVADFNSVSIWFPMQILEQIWVARMTQPPAQDQMPETEQDLDLQSHRISILFSNRYAEVIRRQFPAHSKIPSAAPILLSDYESGARNVLFLATTSYARVILLSNLIPSFTLPLGQIRRIMSNLSPPVFTFCASPRQGHASCETRMLSDHVEGTTCIRQYLAGSAGRED